MTTSASPSQSVSVALCTFNGARFLSRQLQSIASQSCPVNEIIICDDGSTDDTISIVEAFIAWHTRPVQLIRNATRLGITKNFEQAISLCRSPIIFLCDQDDHWHVDKVRILQDKLNRQADLAFSNALVILEDSTPAGYRLWDSIWFDSVEQQSMRDGKPLPVLLRHAVAAGSTLAFRAEFVPLILPIPDLPHCHDIWIALLLGCIGHIEPVDQDLIHYRLHASNVVGMRRYNLPGQIRMARQQIKSNNFGFLAELFALAHDRLAGQDRWIPTSGALKLLGEKIQHSKIRRDLPRRWIDRLPIIGSELRRGNYRKYSYGLKSVLQDLFLR